MKQFVVGSAFLMFISSLPTGATDDHTISLQPVAVVQKVAFMQSYGETLPPMGYVIFCREHQADCRPKGAFADRIQLTTAKFRELKQVNDQVNTTVVPMTDLATDLSGSTPQLSWITPGLCNDGHDCGIAKADAWLSQVVPQITSSTAWQQGGTLFITWDESSAGDGRVALLVVSPTLHGQLTMALDHFSLLATISDRLGVARLGLAKQATSLNSQLG